MEKKHWWSPLILGIILLALGIAILIFPQVSYFTMSVLFGIAIALSGIIYLVMGFSRKIKGRGWLIISGIIELALGLFLTFAPAISAIALPFFLGFWLLFKGFSLVGLGSTISSRKGSGWGLTTFSAIMLIICGLIILFQPIVFGMEAVILWTGISMIISGCTYLNYGFKLRDHYKELL